MKYLILSCATVLMTIIITMCTATIPTLQKVYGTLLLPSIFFVLGLTLTGVILFVKKVQERLPLFIGLLVLAVLLLSWGIPGITAAVGLWNILSWFLTLAVSVGALILGYKMKKLSKKASIILLSFAGGIAGVGFIVFITLIATKNHTISAYLTPLIFIFALLMVLYLTGHGIKRCSKPETSSLLPIWISLITWTAVVIVYVFISIMFPKNKRYTNETQHLSFKILA
uniref:Uncharacterized protein n=1 Tax=Trichobilharzia regenti TaxID=157069 RepID=A0AA85J1P7_TRIRE|nr:unnamed protein product [Trichobilharzia regenti]